jgi:hypothetical protein
MHTPISRHGASKAATACRSPRSTDGNCGEFACSPQHPTNPELRPPNLVPLLKRYLNQRTRRLDVPPRRATRLPNETSIPSASSPNTLSISEEGVARSASRKPTVSAPLSMAANIPLRTASPLPPLRVSRSMDEPKDARARTSQEDQWFHHAIHHQRTTREPQPRRTVRSPKVAAAVPH